jgi:hypothetical protein
VDYCLEGRGVEKAPKTSCEMYASVHQCAQQRGVDKRNRSVNKTKTSRVDRLADLVVAEESVAIQSLR